MKNVSQEIIDKILELLGIKAPTFASNIDVAYQRIYDIQRGKTQRISTELADKIISSYPQFNLAWLLSGEGEMLNTGDATIKGDKNITNTGVMGGGISTMDNSKLNNKIVELEKEIIRLNGEINKRDETIKGLKNELAIRIEMITFLQTKK